MTPKEKANELINTFAIVLGVKEGVSRPFHFAKKCSLIQVDEIIKETMLHDLTVFQHGRTGFWREVKHEIEQL